MDEPATEKTDWTEAKLATTAVEDQEWLAIKEESLFSNETFFVRKYNDLSDEDKQEKRSLTVDEKEHEGGMESEIDADGEDKEDQIQKSVLQWHRQLYEICSAPLHTSTSFLCGMNKRVSVQHRLHLAHAREKLRKKMARAKMHAEQAQATNRTAATTRGPSDVPVVVRLGVLSLFPLIEALRSVPGVHFDQLCTRTLGILLGVMASLPPFALHDEPADCVDAFQDFILSRIASHGYLLNSADEVQAVEALIGLVVSRGTPQHLLAAIDVLLRVHKNTTNVSSTRQLHVGPFLQQLVEYGKNKDVAVMWDNTLSSSWAFSTPSLLSHRKSTSATLGTVASDGAFLYVMHGHNGSTSLMKVGTGYGDTIQGHVYLRNATFLEATPPPPTPPPTAATNSLNPNSTGNSPSGSSDTNVAITSTNNTSPLLAPSSAASAKESVDTKHRKWLIHLRNKLYLYCGETVQKTTEHNTATSNAVSNHTTTTNNNNNNNNNSNSNSNTTTTTTNTNSNASAKVDHTPSGYILHSISTLTLREDGSTKLILSSTNINTHDAIVGDGRFLYVLKAKGQLEVFDPLGSLNSDGHLQPVSSLTLTAATPTTPPSTHPTTPPPPFPSILLEKGGWYITGRQLVCVVAPEVIGSSEHLSRVWALPTGTHSLDVSSRAKPPSPVACYDAYNNVVWCYDEAANKIAEYANSGPAGAVQSDVFPSPYVALSPENIISSQSATTEAQSAQRVTLVILAHMDRIARHHQSANSDPHAESSHKGFCVAHNLAVYHF